MWNSVKSLRLSSIFTKMVMLLVIAFAIALPVFKVRVLMIRGLIFGESEINYVIAIIYICCLLALVALFFLNQLLANIRMGIVFEEKNVKILRRISWCCFFVALVLAVGLIFSMVFLFLSVMAGFVGLILRVVKNVFEAAVELKAENDFTI